MSSSPLRIAIVDDHKLILDALGVWLDKHSPDIEVAVQTNSWPTLMTDPRFPVDVVLLDIDLKDNIPVTLKVGAIRSAGAGVTLMSSLTDSETIRGAFAAGANAFVSKSESIEIIVTAIRAAAEGAEYVSEEGRKHLERHIPVTAPGLTDQERKVVAMYTEGLQMRVIAEHLHLSEETVRTHIRNVRRKYDRAGIDVGTKVKLRMQAVSEGIIRGAAISDERNGRATRSHILR